jgi:hypothetical protein
MCQGVKRHCKIFAAYVITLGLFAAYAVSCKSHMVPTAVEMRNGGSFLEVAKDQLAFPRKFTALGSVIFYEINRCSRSIDFGSPLRAESEKIPFSVSSFSSRGILLLFAVPSPIQPMNSDPSCNNNARAQEKASKIKLHKIGPFLIVRFVLDTGAYQQGYLVLRCRERQPRSSPAVKEDIQKAAL